MALAAIMVPAGAAHAQADGTLIPAWIKPVFAYYADGMITEAELIAALQYLVDQNVIHVAPAAPAAPVMSAEATSYMLQAEAVEQTSLQSRITMIELMSVVSIVVPYMSPDYYDLQGQAAAVQELSTASGTADAAYVNAMREAAADGTITPAEQAGIEAAAAAAERAGNAAQEAAMEMVPALQAGILAATMGVTTAAMVPP